MELQASKRLPWVCSLISKYNCLKLVPSNLKTGLRLLYLKKRCRLAECCIYPKNYLVKWSDWMESQILVKTSWAFDRQISAGNKKPLLEKTQSGLMFPVRPVISLFAFDVPLQSYSMFLLQKWMTSSASAALGHMFAKLRSHSMAPTRWMRNDQLNKIKTLFFQDQRVTGNVFLRGKFKFEFFAGSLNLNFTVVLWIK